MENKPHVLKSKPISIEKLSPNHTKQFPCLTCFVLQKDPTDGSRKAIPVAYCLDITICSQRTISVKLPFTEYIHQKYLHVLNHLRQTHEFTPATVEFIDLDITYYDYVKNGEPVSYCNATASDFIFINEKK